MNLSLEFEGFWVEYIDFCIGSGSSHKAKVMEMDTTVFRVESYYVLALLNWMYAPLHHNTDFHNFEGSCNFGIDSYTVLQSYSRVIRTEIQILHELCCSFAQVVNPQHQPCMYYFLYSQAEFQIIAIANIEIN